MADIVVLALDQSPNNTGFCVAPPCCEKPVFGKLELSTWGKEEPQRVLKFFNFFEALCIKHGVTHIFYELDVPSAGKGTAYFGKSGKMMVKNSKDPTITRNQNAVIAMCWYLSAKLGIPIYAIPSAQMRKRAFGTNYITGLQEDETQRSEFKKMAKKYCAMCGYLIEDDNVAEAILFWDFGCAMLDKPHQMKSNVFGRRTELNLWNGRE